MEKSLICLILLMALGEPVRADSGVLYREIFPNAKGGNDNLSLTGWNAYSGSSAQLDSSIKLSGGIGAPQIVEAVNSFPASDELRHGFIYIPAEAATPLMVLTEELNLHADQITQISWHQNADANDPVHLAVRNGGKWYISEEGFVERNWGMQIVDFSTATWRSLLFTPGSVLSAADRPVVLDKSRVDGVGFYIPALTAKMRLDTVGILSGEPVDIPVDSEALLRGFVLLPVNFSPGEEYGTDARNYQGIPGIERAPNGRLWATWYAGPVWEDHFNYMLVATSGDDGETWTDISFVIDPDGTGPKRIADPVLWLDPDGKLWLFWWLNGDGLSVTMAMTTENPDDENPVWSEPRSLFPGVMMNKPIVTSKGEWLMPSAMWNRADSSRVIVSKDRGQTWSLRGTANIPPERRSCDEQMIVEREDGSFWKLVRTAGYGIGESVSTDNGRTWTEVSDYQKHATTRFTLLKLESGNLLLIRNGPLDVRGGRTHMMAFLSTDDGASWAGGLLLDERGTSYPDATQAPDGSIYAIYDYSRGEDKKILMSVFTEEDILAQEFVSPVGRTNVLVNRATGINPKIGVIADAPPLTSDDNAAELITDAQRAVLEGVGGQSVQPLTHSIELFSDSNYIAYHFSPAESGFFYGKRFVLSPMGETEAVCVSPGMVYVFTPAPDRNSEVSVEAELLAQGFEKTSVEEFRLVFKVDEQARLKNACSVYQKHVEAGERITFGEWGVLVY